MSISKIEGLSTETAARRQKSVITGVPTTATGRQGFQAKLDAASKRRTTATAEQIKRGSNRRLPSATHAKVPTRSTGVSGGREAALGRSIETRGVAQGQRQASRPPDVARRIRRFRTSTPKNVRNKIFKLATDLGLTLVDVWSDATQSSVTLIVQQYGYSETRFVIEHDKTMWRVAIHAERECDRNSLLSEEEALQARFDSVSLGKVALAKGQAEPANQRTGIFGNTDVAASVSL